MGLRAIRFTKTINKYILLEIFGPFCLGLLIFTFVLFMKEVLNLIELVINKGVGLKTVLEMVVYILPSFFVLTVPMAVLVAALSAFGRLSTDSEVTAMKASGISLYTLFVPVLLFSLAASGLTFFLYAKALPWGNHNFRVVMYELARTKASIGLKAQVFNTMFPGLVIYIDEISYVDNSFEGVMISDSRDPQNLQTIFAQKGRLITDEKALRVILRLYDGASHPKDAEVAEAPKYHVVEFPTLDILLSLQGDKNQMNIDLPPTDRDMTIGQLYNQYALLRQLDNTPGGKQAQKNLPADMPPLPQKFSLRTFLIGGGQFLQDSFLLLSPLASPYLVEFHKRFSIPLACLVFGLIGTPLGIQSRRAGKSGGYAVSVVLLLIYYIFITAGESLGDIGKIPAFWAVWTPSILLAITGVYLLIRVARR